MDATSASAPGQPAGSSQMNVSLVRIRMYHTDFVGGASHGRYFDLFEEARTEAFRRAGFHWEQTHREGIAFVVTKIGAEFYRPTAMDDELAIAVYVTRLTKARCVVEYEVRRAGEDELLARGHTDFAFFDTRRNRLVGVPESVRRAVFACSGMWRGEGVGVRE